MKALNAFMYEHYHRQEILRAGTDPEELVVQISAFVPEMIGVDSAAGHLFAHHRHRYRSHGAPNEFYVLEDNTRTPSGVFYMLENRETMMHMFPDLFAKEPRRPRSKPIRTISLKTLESVATRTSTAIRTSPC